MDYIQITPSFFENIKIILRANFYQVQLYNLKQSNAITYFTELIVQLAVGHC